MFEASCPWQCCASHWLWCCQDMIFLNLYFDLRSLNGHSPFYFTNLSFMTLMISRLTSKNGFIDWRMLTICRTKHGSIKWSPPQWCPLLLLGSAILPPSRVPERNLRTPYVVRTYSSFVSDQFPPRFRTYLSIPYITLFHLLHFRSPVD